MPRVEGHVLIRASRDAVITVARNNEAFPEFMDDVQSLNVLSKSEDGKVITTEWVGIIPRFNRKIRWEQEDTWDLERGTCRFRQLMGDFDEFSGVWGFTEEEPGLTRFDSMIDYRLEIPLVGPLIKNVIHKTMENNIEATMRSIKKRCETGG
jgi:ribosome-associated toxin RatA of RatAB toxin-antitoxin module